MYKSGFARHRITIQKRSIINEGYGRTEGDWVDHAKVWAMASPKRGREDFEQDRIISFTIVRFEIRYRDDLESSMRIKWQGRFYRITNIMDHNERRHWMSIDAKQMEEYET